MKTYAKIALLILMMVAASCASRKKAVTPPQPQAFEWLTANLNLEAEDNDMAYNDLSGQLRMRRDSLIWLSVTATMGVELLRAKVSTDSVWIVNRLNKTYLAEPLDALSEQLGMPLSLPWIQTLLLDNNQGLPPVENQAVQIKAFAFGDMCAKVRYNGIKLDKKTTFPLKITDKMERFRLQNTKGL